MLLLKETGIAKLRAFNAVSIEPIFESFPEDAKAYNDRINEQFRDAVDEFNVRLRRSGCGLNYHNGFIQRSSDDTTTFQEVEKPFWSIVSDDTWKNVDIDVKEAIDRRDNNDRDPSFYAARALESTIKIISDRKGWTHGGEKGAHNFIDNLSSRKNAAFIRPWCTAPENTITIRMLAFSG